MKKTVLGFQDACLSVGNRDGDVEEWSMSSMKMKTKMDTRTIMNSPHGAPSKQQLVPAITLKNSYSNAASLPTPNSHNVINLFHPGSRRNTISRSVDRNVVLVVAHEMVVCDGGRVEVGMRRRGMRIMFLIGWLMMMMMMMPRERSGRWRCRKLR